MNQQKTKSPLRHTIILFLTLACHAQASYADHADRDKPMHLEANQVRVDDSRQVSTFEGNVQFAQGTMTIRGDKIIVTQDKDGFTHGTATGQPASFHQKREGSDEFAEGYGERIEYDSNNESMDLLGHARMKMGKDEVSGEHITYSSRTEIFQVHGTSADMQGRGRVRAIIQPKNRSAAADQVAEPLSIKPAGTLTQPESNQ